MYLKQMKNGSIMTIRNFLILLNVVNILLYNSKLKITFIIELTSNILGSMIIIFPGIYGVYRWSSRIKKENKELNNGEVRIILCFISFLSILYQSFRQITNWNSMNEINNDILIIIGLIVNLLILSGGIKIKFL